MKFIGFQGMRVVSKKGSVRFCEKEYAHKKLLSLVGKRVHVVDHPVESVDEVYIDGIRCAKLTKINIEY